MAGPPINNYPADMAAIVSTAGLTDDQVAALGMVLYDRATQSEIAERFDLPRGTVQARIAAAARRLKAIGVAIVLPGRGRPKRSGKEVVVDPDAMKRLTVNTGGRYRWIAARKIDQDDKQGRPQR